MYEFRSLKAGYNIYIKIRYPEGTESLYESYINISALYCDNDKDYIFTLENKTGTRLNGKDPSKLIDIIMMRLGNCLFPVELKVSPSGQIKSVMNFKDIRKRWGKESENILNETYSLPVEKYIEHCKKNLKNERSFLKAFTRDAFNQLYFSDLTKDDLLYSVYNLTETGSVLHVDCIKKGHDDQHIIFNCEDKDMGKCDINYKLSDKGVITYINEKITKKDIDLGDYIKEVNIKLDKKNFEVKKLNKLISFFLN